MLKTIVIRSVTGALAVFLVNSTIVQAKPNPFSKVSKTVTSISTATSNPEVGKSFRKEADLMHKAVSEYYRGRNLTLEPGKGTASGAVPFYEVTELTMVKYSRDKAIINVAYNDNSYALWGGGSYVQSSQANIRYKAMESISRPGFTTLELKKIGQQWVVTTDGSTSITIR
jgi:hypothetical protein